MCRGTSKLERGATAVEYGLIVALAALVLIGGVKATGDVLNESFNNQSSNIENSVPKG